MEPSLGGRNFRLTFLGTNFHFNAHNIISDDLCLVIDSIVSTVSNLTSYFSVLLETLLVLTADLGSDLPTREFM